MKKTKLNLNKQTIKLLSSDAMGRVAGGASITCTCNSMHLSGCCDPSGQWTCETYGCGTTATYGC